VRISENAIISFLVFAVIVFAGGIIGSWILTLIPSQGNDLLSKAIAFLIPTAIIYIIWQKWGRKATKASD
jgi:uncharacterized membrane protein YfcA